MPSSRFEYLFELHLGQKLTETEKEEFLSLLTKPENEILAKALIDRTILTTGAGSSISTAKANTILQNIVNTNETPIADNNRSGRIRRLPGIAAAAILIMVAGAIYWSYGKKANFHPDRLSKRNINNRPARKKITLTLSDGSVLDLDSIGNGAVAADGGANINKGNGVLVYDAGKNKQADAVLFNTLSTPAGAQYQVVLPDRSKVWLNAASSIRFPTAFTGEKREVELIGEAYFEIAKNRQQPFLVHTRDIRVEVLGTHFNVNAYAEESSMETSLLEGSVKVIKGSNYSLLVPGQQAILNNRNEEIKTRTVDMQEVVAWKNGLFNFENADIASMVRQISRWYDVELVYDGEVPPKHFEGKISRNAPLSDVLQILALSNVRLKVFGKRSADNYHFFQHMQQ